MEFAQAREGARAEGDPRGGGRRRRRRTPRRPRGAPAPPHAARARRAGWRNLCRLLTRAHAHTRGRPTSRPPLGATRAACVTLADVEEHAEGLVCLSGCARARRARRADAAAPARRVRARRRCASSCSARSCATTARCNRGARRAGRAPRRRVRGDRQHPRAHARARAAAGRVRRHPRAHDARRLRAAAPRQPRHVLTTPAAMAARFAEHPEAVAGTAELADTLDFDLLEDLGYRYPRAEDPDADRKLAEMMRRRVRRPLPARAPAARGGACAGWRRSWRSSATSGCRASSSCTTSCSSSRARSRGGPRAVARALGAAARPRARVVGLVDRLLPHRPLARRPDRERAAARALPQRGDRRAARHRPRLPARRPRGPDPARARALRPRALGARRGVPDVPRARRDPRDRQGARAAARRDRARRALERGVVGADVGRDIDVALGEGRERPRPLGVARRARRGGARACRATSPSTRAG